MEPQLLPLVRGFGDCEDHQSQSTQHQAHANELRSKLDSIISEVDANEQQDNVDGVPSEKISGTTSGILQSIEETDALKAVHQLTPQISKRISSRKLKSSVLLRMYLNTVDQKAGTRLLSAFEREDAEWHSNPGYRPQKDIKRRKRVRRRAMLRAAELGHGDILLVLLRQCADLVNWKDVETGTTLLIMSAMHGHLDCVIAIAAARALIDEEDRWGFTALHYAAKYNRAKICLHLIKRGADKDVQNYFGRTALELACESGSVQAGKVLFSKGCRVRYKIPPLTLKLSMPLEPSSPSRL